MKTKKIKNLIVGDIFLKILLNILKI